MAEKKGDDWYPVAIFLVLIGFTLVVLFSLEIPYQLMSQAVINKELSKVKKLMGSASL